MMFEAISGLSRSEKTIPSFEGSILIESLVEF